MKISGKRKIVITDNPEKPITLFGILYLCVTNRTPYCELIINQHNKIKKIMMTHPKTLEFGCVCIFKRKFCTIFKFPFHSYFCHYLLQSFPKYWLKVSLSSLEKKDFLTLLKKI